MSQKRKERLKWDMGERIELTENNTNQKKEQNKRQGKNKQQQQKKSTIPLK